MPRREKPGDDELCTRLTSEQFEVTQRCGTEPPFANAYWNNHEPGIYVDVVSGEPLFSSLDKFDSDSGWPSSTRAIDPTNLDERRDLSLGMVRTEVRLAGAGSHLGHALWSPRSWARRPSGEPRNTTRTTWKSTPAGTIATTSGIDPAVVQTARRLS